VPERRESVRAVQDGAWNKAGWRYWAGWLDSRALGSHVDARERIDRGASQWVGV